MTDSRPTRPVRVRFAPSPTGDLHIGGVRTAQFNWMFAHRYGGKFILRIEDTDQKRTQEQSLAGIMDGLRWAGLNWDEGPDIGGPYGPYVQSERLELYQKWANWLVDHDKVYRAYETAQELEEIDQARQKANGSRGYDRRARRLTREDWARLDAEGCPYVLRLKVPLEGYTTVLDMVRGPIRVDNNDLQDQILLKSDGFPTYHLAHVIDDHFMEITHIIRAEEWIASTPVHKLIYEAFGWEMPEVAHVPVILKQFGKGKMSKRDEGASISYFINRGYLPEAVTNFLCNVGWNYGKVDAEGKEIQVFTKEEAAAIFDITRVTTSGTKFDLVKLQWLNGEHIRLMAPIELAQRVRPYLEKAGLQVNGDTLLRVIPLIQQRMKLLTDVVEVAGFFFRENVTPTTPATLIPKKMTLEQTRLALTHARDAIASMSDFSPAMLESTLRPMVEGLALTLNQFFGAIRLAVTGQIVSPPLFESLEVIGRDVTLARLDAALKTLQTQTA